MGTTYADVVAACEELARSERAITGETVRNLLGGGSYRDISAHLRQYRETHRDALVPMRPIPESLTKSGQRLVTDMWSLTTKIIHDETEVLRRHFHDDLAAAEAVAQGLIEEVDHLRLQLADIAKKVDQSVLTEAELTRRAERADALAEERLREIDRCRLEYADLRDREIKAVEIAAELRGQLSVQNGMWRNHGEHPSP